MIQELPGVSVTGGSTINIRGAANLWGPVAPLLILDGVPVSDFSNVSPTQVESVNVLKGASAAIYGSRGYGGVIVVKTKKIQVGK
jgi:TonB-dependent SusC/RagA subfamily outer membrane receptor